MGDVKMNQISRVGSATAKKKKASSVIKAQEYKEEYERAMQEKKDQEAEAEAEGDLTTQETHTKFLLKTVDDLQDEMSQIHVVMKSLEKHYKDKTDDLRD